MVSVSTNPIVSRVNVKSIEVNEQITSSSDSYSYVSCSTIRLEMPAISMRPSVCTFNLSTALAFSIVHLQSLHLLIFALE